MILIGPLSPARLMGPYPRFGTAYPVMHLVLVVRKAVISLVYY